MASADSCSLELGLSTEPVGSRRTEQVSPGKNADCPHTPVASTPSPLGNLGFAVCGQLTLARVPPMRFVFLRPWVSPPASFRPHLAVTPLPLAHSKGCLPCRGLSPPSQRPCRAHQKGLAAFVKARPQDVLAPRVHLCRARYTGHRFQPRTPQNHRDCEGPQGSAQCGPCRRPSTRPESGSGRR